MLLQRRGMFIEGQEGWVGGDEGVLAAEEGGGVGDALSLVAEHCCGWVSGCFA